MEKDHLHTLKRITGKRTFFMCADPDCPWVRRREYLHGKRFRCPYCGLPYIVQPKDLRLKTPHCKVCTNSQQLVKQPEIESIIEKLVDADLFNLGESK